MTKREKLTRAKIKKELQKKILPPDKSRLNRKKYVGDAQRELRQINYIESRHLLTAISVIMDLKDKNSNISSEAIGVAKAVFLAKRLTEFFDKCKEEEKDTYFVKDLYEYVKDILNA